MKNHSSVPDLSDSALEHHIRDLQSDLDKLTISLQLATAERQRRSNQGSISPPPVKSETLPTSIDNKELPSFTPLQVGTTVRIKNKYKGNKGKVGKVIDLSERTATVHIPQKGNFIKYLHNLEIISEPNEK